MKQQNIKHAGKQLLLPERDYSTEVRTLGHKPEKWNTKYHTKYINTYFHGQCQIQIGFGEVSLLKWLKKTERRILHTSKEKIEMQVDVNY